MTRRVLFLICLLAYTSVCIVLLSVARPQEAVLIEPPPTYPDVAPLPTPERDKPPYLGEYRITVYTAHCDGGVWGYQTATGVTSAHLATCAVDPAEIPLGTVLDVGGYLVMAVDTGSAVKGQVIDVFYDGTPEDARDWLATFGDRADVWLVEEEQDA